MNTHFVTCSVLKSHIRTVSWNKSEIAQGVPRSHVNVLGALRCSELNSFLKLLHINSIYWLTRKFPAGSPVGETTYNVSMLFFF